MKSRHVNIIPAFINYILIQKVLSIINGEMIY